MRTAHLSAAVLALALGAIGPAIALESPTRRNIADIRLLPPAPQPMQGARPPVDFQGDMERALRIVRERHPEVFETPSSPTVRYAVGVLQNADGRVERTEVRRLDAAGGSDLGVQQLMMQSSPDSARSTMINVLPGRPLPDGTTSKSNLLIVLSTLPQNFDASRAVSRVHAIVRERHATLLLPADGEVLNRLTIFLDESGKIERENVELIRFDSLRRAPLEDEKFAERMAERFAQTLAVDQQKIGAVGFTYVNEGSARIVAQPDGSRTMVGDRRTLLVQYAWPRKPGETGPSMPMAAPVQQRPQSFDTDGALALAQFHFQDAFSNGESAAGTPTIVLSPTGEVLRTGLVQYRSGQIHEVSLQQQLMPGVSLGYLISPTLKDAQGGSAVVTFAWVKEQAR